MPPSQDADRNARPDTLEIYRQLRQGLGHQHVGDDNVDELISMASNNGDTTIEKLLREWRAPCSDGSEGVPKTIAPTPGFNKLNAKH